LNEKRFSDRFNAEPTMKKLSILIAPLLTLALVLSVPRCSDAPSPPAEAAQPNQESDWPVSTPEEQGVDSENLLQMIKTIRKEDRNVHSILIVRHGRLLLEAYFSPYKKDFKHIIFSATKSISSLLVGIALQEGFIKSLDTPLVDFFPEYRGKLANLDERKKALTLKHVLTMTDGLDWIDWPYRVERHGDFLNLLSSADGAKYYLDKPMKELPGGKFNYNSGSSYMLAAIIQKATGKNALEFGREKLFRPLGITDIAWGKYQAGIYCGGSEFFIRPRDFAKIGSLVLNQGKWEGKQVVPAEWISEISREHVKSDFLQFGYSFQWYIDETLPEKSISAQGLGGQYLFVVPGQDLAAVFTAGMIRGSEADTPFFYLRDFILPALKSAKALPANPRVAQKLAMMLRECENPPPKKVSPLPPLAEKISGHTFMFPERSIEKNLWGLETASLFFDKKGECRLKMTFSGNIEQVSLGFDAMFRSSPGAPRLPVLDAVIGLDGAYRTVMVKTDAGVMPYSAKGRWKDEKNFEVTSLSGWSLPEVHTFEFQTENTVIHNCRTIFYNFSLRGEKK